MLQNLCISTLTWEGKCGPRGCKELMCALTASQSVPLCHPDLGASPRESETVPEPVCQSKDSFPICWQSSALNGVRVLQQCTHGGTGVCSRACSSCCSLRACAAQCWPGLTCTPSKLLGLAAMSRINLSCLMFVCLGEMLAMHVVTSCCL